MSCKSHLRIFPVAMQTEFMRLIPGAQAATIPRCGHLPHVECNLDRNRPLTWMTTRTPENIVVNLPDVGDHELRDWLDRG